MAGTGMSTDVLGAVIFEQLKNQGMTDDDAHRAAQAAVTEAFGPQGPVNTWQSMSASGATGSAQPAPGSTGPKLPPPSQMAANWSAQAVPGSLWGRQPPPLPQSPPTWMTADWWPSTGQNWDHSNWGNWNWNRGTHWDSSWNRSWWNSDHTQAAAEASGEGLHHAVSRLRAQFHGSPQPASNYDAHVWKTNC